MVTAHYTLMNDKFSIVQKQNLMIITSVKSTIRCIFNNLKLPPCILLRFLLCLLMLKCSAKGNKVLHC